MKKQNSNFPYKHHIIIEIDEESAESGKEAPKIVDPGHYLPLYQFTDLNVPRNLVIFMLIRLI